MKKFNIPDFYKSSIIKKIKSIRQEKDPRKKDLKPTVLDYGMVRFHLARHFGFCFGVENAIEISYKALEENPNKKIYLLSQMIHNADVNDDLENKGIHFIMDTLGNQLIPWEKINADDVVIIPAFGTTLEILDLLKEKGVSTKEYNTTCPFVTRVWKRADQLGKNDHTIIIHGKYQHEETRATFSFSKKNAPCIVIKNMDEAVLLSEFILGKKPIEEFKMVFKDRYSANFDPKKDLQRIGVINQTTMLAYETQNISNFLKGVMEKKFGAEQIHKHMANTRDTLCYATNENQDATYGLIKNRGDLAIVIGGYNSSNTSHLVELCEKKLPTYFISNESEILSKKEIKHYDFKNKKMCLSKDFIPDKKVVDILITSGASCPDAIVENVMQKLLSFFSAQKKTQQILESIEQAYN